MRSATRRGPRRSDGGRRGPTQRRGARPWTTDGGLREPPRLGRTIGHRLARDDVEPLPEGSSIDRCPGPPRPQNPMAAPVELQALRAL